MHAVWDWKCRCGEFIPNVPATADKVTCPKCGLEARKVYSAPMVVFKGGGWTPVFYGQGDK